MRLAETKTVRHDAISRLEARILGAQHPAGQIDARDEGEFADDGCFAGYGEAILIVHR
jgi:hypothetical protein